MKQDARPQEAKDKENFSQIANILIQGYPELDLQSRYVPIALTSICWEEKYYPLSLRQIASLAHVDHTALRSRNGAKPREGILDRLKRVGILDYKDEKPVDSTTGKEGRSQTYICIRYSNIWKENARFFAGKKAIKVIPQTVDRVNSANNGEVKTVDRVNHTVDTSNVTVDRVNHTVDNASVNAGHNTVIPEYENTFLGARESEDDQAGHSSEEEKKSDESVSTEAPEHLSYSQQPTTTYEDESDNHSQFGGFMSHLIEETEASLAVLEQQLFASSGDSWLQENIPSQPEQKKKPTIPVSVKPDIPDVNQMSSTQVGKQRKNRMAEIMALADATVGVRVPRSPKKFVGEALDDLVDGDYSDEDIVFSIKDLQARKRDMNFTEIAKNMANAVGKLKNGLHPGNVLSFPQEKQYRGQSQQQEVRVVKAKDASHYGAHLNAADYDEEPIAVRR